MSVWSNVKDTTCENYVKEKIDNLLELFFGKNSTSDSYYIFNYLTLHYFIFNSVFNDIKL